MAFITCLNFYHFFLASNYITTYLRHRMHSFVKIYGNPFSQGNFISNISKIYLASSNYRIDFQSKVKDFSIKKKDNQLTNYIGKKGGKKDSINQTNTIVKLMDNTKFEDRFFHENVSFNILENLNFNQIGNKFSIKNETFLEIPQKFMNSLENQKIQRANTCHIKVNISIGFNNNLLRKKKTTFKSDPK